MKKVTNFKSKSLRRFMFAMQNREYIGKLIVKDREYLVKREPKSAQGKCPTCDRPVILGQNYCSYCGQKLDWRDSTEHRFFAIQMNDDNSKGVCRNCLEIVPYGEERCPDCGCLLGWGWENNEGTKDSFDLYEEEIIHEFDEGR